MLKRSYRTQESLVRYWAQQAVELCEAIDDPSLAEPAQPVMQVMQGLNKPRRIVLVGGARSGKSALLSHMIGSAVPAAVAPEGPYLRWRFRCDDGDAAHSRFLPLENLEGLEVVDTQDCARPEVRDVLTEYLPGTDVVIPVVDARAPQESPVWELLAAVPEEGIAACMVALTYTQF